MNTGTQGFLVSVNALYCILHDMCTHAVVHVCKRMRNQESFLSAQLTSLASS